MKKAGSRFAMLVSLATLLHGCSGEPPMEQSSVTARNSSFHDLGADAAEKQTEPQDVGSESSILFDCGNGGQISVRFTGPDTIELVADELRRQLILEPAASGARYRGDGIVFWNKGDEALLFVGEEPFTCRLQ